jgi:ElaB/YqjD/DUF883 family membrane-anchored ribosome-binding protein
MATSDIEAQLQKLKADIADLAKTVAAVSADTAGAYRAKAGNVAGEAIAASHNAIDSVRTEFGVLEKDVVDRIRTRPLQALGLAIGVGFLLAFISRR